MNLDEYKQLCGKTPLIKISDKIYGKLETYNPTGSVKDRMISYVVDQAICGGLITDETILCEATSGNTGIALSSVAANLGLECRIFMPGNMSIERKQMMSAFGATFVDAPADDFERAIEMRDEFMSKNPNAWSPMQFSNPANVECHKQTTALEILKQVNSIGLKWSVFVHGSGTGGTIEGVRQFCAENLPRTKIVMAVPAESPHGIQGIGDGRDFLADPDVMDDVVVIKTQDAIERAKNFAEETGLFVGISSGANILASERFAADNEIAGIIITMLCDRGERYLSVYGEK